MGTVIMVLIFPLGLAFFFFEKRTNRENQELFNTYVEKIKNSGLSNSETLKIIDQMYYDNGYKRVLLNDEELIVEKKNFQLGVALMMLGTMAYFGPFFYYLYFRYLKKPDQIHIVL